MYYRAKMSFYTTTSFAIDFSLLRLVNIDNNSANKLVLAYLATTVASLSS